MRMRPRLRAVVVESLVEPFLVAQFVRILRVPSHWPFILVIAVSASYEQRDIRNRFRRTSALTFWLVKETKQ